MVCSRWTSCLRQKGSHRGGRTVALCEKLSATTLVRRRDGHDEFSIPLPREGWVDHGAVPWFEWAASAEQRSERDVFSQETLRPSRSHRDGRRLGRRHVGLRHEQSENARYHGHQHVCAARASSSIRARRHAHATSSNRREMMPVFGSTRAQQRPNIQRTGYGMMEETNDPVASARSTPIPSKAPRARASLRVAAASRAAVDRIQRHRHRHRHRRDDDTEHHTIAHLIVTTASRRRRPSPPRVRRASPRSQASRLRRRRHVLIPPRRAPRTGHERAPHTAHHF